MTKHNKDNYKGYQEHVPLVWHLSEQKCLTCLPGNSSKTFTPFRQAYKERVSERVWRPCYWQVSMPGWKSHRYLLWALQLCMAVFTLETDSDDSENPSSPGPWNDFIFDALCDHKELCPCSQTSVDDLPSVVVMPTGLEKQVRTGKDLSWQTSHTLLAHLA